MRLLVALLVIVQLLTLPRSATLHGHPAPRRVRPPGDPACLFLSLMPHRLRV
jgi:hypothetical protein